jgi:hypothetical protein
MHCKKSHEHLTNDKVQSPYIGCNSKKKKKKTIMNSR